MKKRPEITAMGTWELTPNKKRVAHSDVKQYLDFRINDRDFQRRILTYYGTCWRVRCVCVLCACVCVRENTL